MKNDFILRISSGKYRGKGIYSPADYDIRPTSARVKEALFNIIRNRLYGASFLDMFAGSGQMGLEALSNGAKNVVFSDKDTALVKKNTGAVCPGDNFLILKGDFRQLNFNTGFDFIFADPPYDAGLYEDIQKIALPLLAEGGVLILEHSSDYAPSVIGSFGKTDTRKYGSRSLTFLEVCR